MFWWVSWLIGSAANVKATYNIWGLSWNCAWFDQYFDPWSWKKFLAHAVCSESRSELKMCLIAMIEWFYCAAMSKLQPFFVYIWGWSSWIRQFHVLMVNVWMSALTNCLCLVMSVIRLIHCLLLLCFFIR